MFVISQSETYTWPVAVQVAVSGGRFETHKFDAEFKRISQSRFKEIIDQIQAETITDAKLAEEVVTGWKGVMDEDGKTELPFSHIALSRLLDVPAVAAAVVTAFFESRSGAKRKN